MQRWEGCYILLWSAPKKSSIGHRLSSSIFIMSTKRDGTVRSGKIQVTELVRQFVYAYEFCIMPVPGHYVKLNIKRKQKCRYRTDFINSFPKENHRCLWTSFGTKQVKLKRMNFHLHVNLIPAVRHFSLTTKDLIYL